MARFLIAAILLLCVTQHAAGQVCQSSCRSNAECGACTGCTFFVCAFTTPGAATGTCVGLGGTNCPSGVRADPEMIGLDGRKFYFDGEAGKAFNLISEKDHQVNAKFVEGPHKIAQYGDDAAAHNGTYIGAIGMKLYNTTIQMDANEEGQMSVLYNGADVDIKEDSNYTATFSTNNVDVEVQLYRPNFGHSVLITTKMYHLLVYATPKQWDEVEQQVTRGHLNMLLSANIDTYSKSDVHGILGQIGPDSSADNSMLPPELQTSFLGEGTDADYIVTDLFADDFKFNRFGAGMVKELNSAPKDSAAVKASVPLTIARRRILGIDLSQNWMTIGAI